MLENLNPLLEMYWMETSCIIIFNNTWIYRYDFFIEIYGPEIKPPSDRSTVQTMHPLSVIHH